MLACIILTAGSARADLVRVRYQEGLTRGFLVLRTLDGKQVADGDSSEVAHGDRVTSHLVFHFNDGSLYEDTTTFTQDGTFRLISDHVIQKGPSFKTSLESFIDVKTGTVTVKYAEKGKQKTLTKKLDLPPDVSNGLLFTITKNIPQVRATVSYLATTPKPMLVSLVIAKDGRTDFFTDHAKHSAVRYVLRVRIGGLEGALARLTRRKLPVIQIWVVPGEAPTVVAWVGPLYESGPDWRIDLVSPRHNASLR